MSAELAVAVGLALAFAFTNGFHDAANAIATLVATRAAKPIEAVILASVFNLLGPILVGAAVANTIAKIVDVAESEVIPVVASGLVGAVVWNALTWWRGLPSSSSHALVGGLVGAALVEAGVEGVNWGGFDGWRPVGVAGTLVALAVSPLLGVVAGFAVIRLLRAGLRRATRRVNQPLRAGQWAMASGLAFSHGANDAQKTVGVIAALLLAAGEITSLAVPIWVPASAAAALTLGTAFGGWRIVKTIGTRIYDVRPLDSLASQTSSAAVILGASLVGAPVSTTHVVASSVVGVGGGRRRWRHVHWQIVREMGLAWLTTIPAAGAIGAISFVLWRAVA